MKNVFIASHNIFSPLGKTSGENFMRLKQGETGIRLHDRADLSEQPVYASLFDPFDFITDTNFTRFEQLLVASITDALQNSGVDASDPATLLIVSSTKGNIDLLEKDTHTAETRQRLALHTSAKIVAGHFGMKNAPLVISNACISGLLGILIGKRLIAEGRYQHVIVAGADIISKFVLSGFQSFLAVSPEPCKPFDADRKGITLGEAAATVVLTSQKELSKGVHVMGGSVSNDANHISAPSRTGDELNYIIRNALTESSLQPADIGFISTHGTATLYNDEMESKAIVSAGLQAVPVNSLKGFFGHTLGAAGLVESIISIQSMEENIILPTPGFSEIGVENVLNIPKTIVSTPIHHFIKTASGFGGCNAALIFSKD